MKNGYFFKFAAENIKKNTMLYIPRILAEAGLLGSFYILFTLALDKRLSEALGGSYLPSFMMFGAVVIGLLSFVIILYINRFLMKQRKGEYGLYNVLGMEKRHIIKVLFHESVITSCVAYIVGILFGILFYKLSSVLICRLLRSEIVAGFYYLNVSTIVLPVVIFAALDSFAFFINSIGIHMLKPVELLSERHKGEKEPKIKWVMFIIGIICLTGGYYISLTTKSPLEALMLFFFAVILVIVGTYFLFAAGSTFVLKKLKNNKKYYYNKKHMPAVSGLLFRMKRNAVGLASITILATGVLVMISTTVSLYSGVQDTADTNYPKQLYLSANYISNDKTIPVSQDELEQIVAEAANENGLEITDVEKESFLSVSYLFDDGKLLTKSEVTDGYDIEDLTQTIYITLKTYSQLRGDHSDVIDKNSLNLKEDEIAFCQISTSVNNIQAAPDSLIIHGTEYKVKKALEYFPIQNTKTTITNCVGIIVSDENVLNNIYLAQKKDYGEFASEYEDRIGVEFSDEKAAAEVGNTLEKQITEKLRKNYTDEISYLLDTKWESLKNVLELYGTFLFLGILLGFVCLFSTALIIYYKQISEGYEDKERFRIMEKIGMEPREVKKTIGSQLVLQLFLPLVTAAIHTAFAFPILLKLLRILMLSNTNLFIICTVITFAVFACVYIAVYLLTSKTYYKIVH